MNAVCQRLSILAVLGGLVCASAGQPASARPDAPALDIFISAGDSWWMGTWLPVDSEKSITESVQMWSDLFNIKRVYWRGEQEELMIDYGLIRKDNLQYYEFLETWERYLMKELHLNQVLIEQAHAKGMEVYLWAPLFDFGGPADNGGCKEYPYYGQLNLTLKHPEWMPVDRYGVRRQNGPIELSYPAARKALIDMYLYYIDRDKLDGITFFTYCENYGLRFEDEFGYNQPIVDEYKRRYGVDIRTQPFDKHLWYYLRGEYVTQFLRELKAALSARGKKLGVRLNHKEPNFTDRWYVPTYVLTPGRIYIDWERWVREGIVDEIAISGREPQELQTRTIENVLQATHGTKVSVTTLTSEPFAERFKPYTAQGMRLMLFATDDASYFKLVYPEQSIAALEGNDIYAILRLLAQISQGQTQCEADKLIPLTKHEHILVRRMALQALGHLKDPKALPSVEEALNDPERSVRAAAVFALRDLHGPQTVSKLIAAVRNIREFQIFEAVSTTLSSIDSQYFPEILALASDPDVLMRRMGAYVLGRRGDARAVPALVSALDDPDIYVRFRAAHALQAFGKESNAVDALVRALDDTDVVVQDRAATSLAIALVEGSTTKPRFGLESSVLILKTPTGPLENIVLTQTQERALAALSKKFKEFGDGSTRRDLEWGFRPVGNAMLAFGAEGGRQLQEMIDQKKDHQLAELAWQVLYIRQGMENFCLLPGTEEENERIYRTYPTRTVVKTDSAGGEPYDPTKN